MNYVHEFRNGAQAKQIAEKIHRLVQQVPENQKRPFHIMEVCGGHTHTIFRYGLAQLLPKEIEFIHGPGCPVCVLPTGVVDDALALAAQKQVIFTTFGDAMRVPGSRKSLLQAKAEGCDIRMVYSPLDALTLAKKHPEKEVIFFGLGFETTMPSTALTILEAQKQQIANFSVFCNHITIEPPLKAMLEMPNMRLDGFIGPGHVSMVIGSKPYQFIAQDYHRPFVITGFEPLDILQSVYMLTLQLKEGRSEVENQYKRIVPEEGNPVAKQAMETVFEPRKENEWRGLGNIEDSGVQIRSTFPQFNAEQRFDVVRAKIADPEQAKCGEVVTGSLKPDGCSLFGRECTPETPIGALMVSSEGACAAAYQYSPRVDLQRYPQHKIL